MSDAEVAQNMEEFSSSGRTGRRNALPDILDEKHTGTSTAGIAEGLEKMQCSGKNEGPYYNVLSIEQINWL